jgi:hypothetical protein
MNKPQLPGVPNSQPLPVLPVLPVLLQRIVGNSLSSHMPSGLESDPFDSVCFQNVWPSTIIFLPRDGL